MKIRCKYVRLRKCIYLFTGVLFVSLVVSSVLISNLDQQINEMCTGKTICLSVIRNHSGEERLKSGETNARSVNDNRNLVQSVLHMNPIQSPSVVAVESQEELFIVSAFFTNNPKATLIKIVTITSIKDDHFSVRCLLQSSSVKDEVSALAELVPEPNYGYKYRTALISCQTTTEQKPVTASLALKDTPWSLPVKIIYPRSRNSTITRCYPALHSSMNDVGLILQSIEISKTFGADYFIFYNFSIGPEVAELLEYYQKIGYVQLLEWWLPVSAKDIHYYGQVAILHDCLYRNRKTSKYIFFGDLDEMLVPKKHSNWLDLLKSTSLTRRNRCSAWIFQHAFFPTFQIKYLPKSLTTQTLESHTKILKELKSMRKLYYMNPKLETLDRFNMTFLEHTLRSKIHSVFDRSKYFVIPAEVDMLGIHKIERFVSSTYCFIIAEVALLHHYRSDWSVDMIPKWTYDDSILQFSNLIIEQFERFFKDFEDS